MPDYDLQITPEEAGWAFCGLRVLAGEAAFDTGDDELIVLPLEGGAEVTVDGESFTLRGRDGVFDGPTDFVYAPRDARVEISATRPRRAAILRARSTAASRATSTRSRSSSAAPGR